MNLEGDISLKQAREDATISLFHLESFGIWSLLDLPSPHPKTTALGQVFWLQRLPYILCIFSAVISPPTNKNSAYVGF